MKELVLRAGVVARTSNLKISRRRLADYVKTKIVSQWRCTEHYCIPITQSVNIELKAHYTIPMSNNGSLWLHLSSTLFLYNRLTSKCFTDLSHPFLLHNLWSNFSRVKNIHWFKNREKSISMMALFYFQDQNALSKSFLTQICLLCRE